MSKRVALLTSQVAVFVELLLIFSEREDDWVVSHGTKTQGVRPGD